MVGSFPANPWGIYDMHGTVWEWVNDPRAANYYTEFDPDRLMVRRSARAVRILRGGSWVGTPRDIRSARRNGLDSTMGDFDVGFRIARTPAGASTPYLDVSSP